MSLDKSLRTKSSLARHRNVLSRAERIDTLKETDRWEDGRSPFGLPKVAHRKATVGGKDKKKEETAATPAAGAAPAATAAAPAATGAKAAAGAKPAAAAATKAPAGKADAAKKK